MIEKFLAFLRLLRFWRTHPLASRDMGGTLLRFFRWQIGSTILGTPVVWPWIGSTCLVMERGMTGSTMNIYCGLQDFRDMAFVLHFLRSEDHFVDLGANVGSYTVLASGVIGACSLCVEPIPATFQKLEMNLACNQLGNLVRAECCAAGAGAGTLIFIADQDTTNRVAPAGYAGKTQEVPVRTADELLRDFPATMWKVDVEGFEEQLLAGAEQALRAATLQVVMMEGENVRIREIMTRHGFQLFTYEPFSRQLAEGDFSAESHNWLWIRDRASVVRRLETAPRYTVNGIEF